MQHTERKSHRVTGWKHHKERSPQTSQEPEQIKQASTQQQGRQTAGDSRYRSNTIDITAEETAAGSTRATRSDGGTAIPTTAPTTRGANRRQATGTEPTRQRHDAPHH